jgi:hypothetical protein
VRFASVLLLFALVACKRSPPAPVVMTNDAAEQETEAAAEPAVPLVERMEVFAIRDAFARATFYTWTTKEQIAALRASERLLVATAYQGSGPSRFVLDLEDLVRSNGKGADVARKVLLDERLARRRYAWIAPFATRVPLAGKPYGDALVRVTLKPDSLVARFHPEDADPWTIVDLSGKPARFDPARLGVVYHVRSSKTATAPFREYVLCNEAQIATYEVGTPTIAREVALEKKLLLGVAAAIDDDAAVRRTWRDMIAFDTDKYAPTKSAIENVANALDGYDPTPPALVRP